MSDFLERVVRERRADAARLRAERTGPAVAKRRDRRSLREALVAQRRRGRLGVIAELKRVSPAHGRLAAPVFDPAAQARAYAAAGAAAISVLTEPRHWGGSLDDLRAVRAAVAVPLLCKDVIVDAIQIDAAAEAGADAVLLIAEALDDAELAGLIQHARQQGLEALVEAHEAAGFGRAVRSGAAIVGVNARNLRDPRDLDRSRARLLHTFARPEQLLVAESGIASAEDALALPARVDAVLVGTALMRARDPGALVRALAAVTRATPAEAL